MSKIGNVILAVIAVVLIGLASLGVRELIIGQESPPPPTSPQELSADEARQLADAADAAALQAVVDFISSNSDPCSFPLRERLAEPGLLYDDMASLLNDSLAVVLGEPVGHVIEAPGAGTLAGRILTTVEVNSVLAGSVPSSQVTVDLGNVVMQNAGNLGRLSGTDLDACEGGPLVLFLQRRTLMDSAFAIPYQGWARLVASNIETARINEVFDPFTSAENLMVTVGELFQQQAAQGLARGELLCKQTWPSLSICPGDSINLYQVFGLSTFGDVRIVVTDPGPSQLAVSRTDLPAADPASVALVDTLDVVVSLGPRLAAAEDRISVRISLAAPINERSSLDLSYSPSAGTVQIGPYAGSFAAPDLFVQLMAAFEVAPVP